MEWFYGKFDEQSGRPGSTFIEGSFDEQSRTATLKTIRVESALRGSGLADSLLEMFVTAARMRGMQRIRGVFSPDEGCEDRARRFYERNGFRIGSDERPFGLGGTYTFETVEYDLTDPQQGQTPTS
ncbi:MAG: Acetyltransferase (GNAT) family protein [candidate division WS6 bacterium OLB20]|uniref:Acetyltransferase (GNAT) family protein n=1 Tax=candidate division WS6 bacterium OLB20 TaxID=1617426 RepID=A0A136LWF4_9BACT|nr:MAG: Acetyltransferase (GNAT) family protein [candidate division WS6 bacterium OLB20]